MDVVSVARLLARPDADLRGVLAEIIAEVHVPYLAQFRYRGSGLLKRAAWEQAWELQRAEDRTGRQLDIPVPTIYASADFVKLSYWRQRGKLDMSKERFISYRWQVQTSLSGPLCVVSISLAGVLLIGLVFGLARLTRAALPATPAERLDWWTASRSRLPDDSEQVGAGRGERGAVPGQQPARDEHDALGGEFFGPSPAVNG